MKKNKNKVSEYLAMSWHFSASASEWEGEKGYWAWVSELPNCSTFASTQSQALSTVAEMLPTYLNAAIESNAIIPVPEGRDPEADDAGGTIVLRVPKSLHIGLKYAAQAENTSLNQFALYALTKAVYQTTAPTYTVAESPLGRLKKSSNVKQRASKSPTVRT
jgi:predicted RNase H-like HicB family nuclease